MLRSFLAALTLAAGLALMGQPAAADIFLYVRDGIYLNARTGPGTRYPRHRVLRPGTRLRIIARQGNWARVQTPEGLLLWVFLSYLVDRGPQPQLRPAPPIFIFPRPPRPRYVPPRRPVPYWSRPRRPRPPHPHPHGPDGSWQHFHPNHPGWPVYPGR